MPKSESSIPRGFIPLALAIGIAALLLSSCFPKAPSRPDRGEGCGWDVAAEGSKAAIFGPNDFHAGYMSYLAPVKPGGRVVIRSQFPHCRYISFVLYDQDMMVADSLPDYTIVPAKGVNPFLPGADRSGKWLGEYELQVLMEDPPPKEQRKPNTLYAGKAASGKQNRSVILAYRVYLPDQGYGYEDANPLAVYGGVEPGMIQLYAPDAKPECVSSLENRAIYSRMAMTALKRNLKELNNPAAIMGEAKNPLVWLNAASRDNSRQSGIIPNEETQYVISAFQSDLGPLLVLRWNAAVTPEQTWRSEPFPEDHDMRYWSLSFAAFKKGEGIGIVTEKTVADVEVPHLADGSRELVIGFNNMPRPESVPPEMWVGLSMSRGLIIMRNIQVRESYPGNFALMPAGPVTSENARFTPGGVYCSAQELESNPDIGLSR